MSLNANITIVVDVNYKVKQIYRYIVLIIVVTSKL